MDRVKLLLILATMPDEAFGWFLVWAARGKPTGADDEFIAQMFPDGLGGFSPESRASIAELRKAAAAYMKAQAK